MHVLPAYAMNGYLKFYLMQEVSGIFCYHEEILMHTAIFSHIFNSVVFSNQFTEFWSQKKCCCLHALIKGHSQGLGSKALPKCLIYYTFCLPLKFSGYPHALIRAVKRQ